MSEQAIANHIFICHSSADAAFVQRLANDLQHVGIPIWVDHLKLKSGTRNWEKAIREALSKSRALIYVASQTAAQSNYVQDELSIAEMEGCKLLAAWAVGDDKRWLDCTPLGYGKLQNADLRGDRYQSGLQELLDSLSNIPIKAIVSLPTPTVEEPPPTTEILAVKSVPANLMETTIPPRNPYKALNAFTEMDARDFFGRDALIATLLKRLHEYPSFLGVIGASGSGKSSVMMAGLIPQLRQLHPDWVFLQPIKPGTHPIEALAVMLHSTYFSEGSINAIREDLNAENSRGLIARGAAIPRQAKSRVVLLIDQFEEVFTQAVYEQERQQFINIITSAASDPASNVTILLTLRADFFDRPLRDSELGKLIIDHCESILPMSITDLKQIIERPAANVGLKFDDGLVSDLVFDTRDQVGGLPLLEYTLEQLFLRRDGTQLTRHAYETMSGVKGALAHRAEETYTLLATDGIRRQLIRTLFLRLIEQGGTEQDTTRRRAPISELEMPDPVQTRMLRKFAETFVNARLLTTDEVGGLRTIEVSHEALIREWELLGRWLAESRSDLQTQRRLTLEAAEWDKEKRDVEYLARGRRLEEFEVWSHHTSLALNESEQAFLTASIDERTRQDTVDRSKEQQATRTAQVAKNFRRITVLLGVVGIMAVITTVVALVQAEQARIQVAQANASVQFQNQRLAAVKLVSAAEEASRKLGSDPQLSLLYAIQAMKVLGQTEAKTSGEIADKLATKADAERTLYSVINAAQATQIVTDKLGMLAATYSPDGRYIATSNLFAGLELLDAKEASFKVIRSYTLPEGVDPDTRTSIVHFSKDGTRLLAGGQSGNVRIWDVQSGNLLASFDNDKVPLTSVAFSPDEKFVVTGDENGTIRLWNVQKQQLEGEFKVTSPNCNRSNTCEFEAAFSPDGNKIATAGKDGLVTVWDAQSRTALLTINTPSSRATSPHFTPDGSALVVGTDNGLILVYDATSGRELHHLIADAQAINTLSLSADGTRVIAGGLSRAIYVWDIANSERLFTLSGHGGQIYQAEFAPGEQSILSAADENHVRLWSLAGQQNPYLLTGHTREVYTVAYSPDGKLIVTGSNDFTLRIWDAQTGKTIRVLGGEGATLKHTDSVIAGVFLHNGEQIMSAGVDGRVIFWDVATGNPLYEFPFPQTVSVSYAILTPDEKFLLTTNYSDHDIHQWDMTTHQEVRRYSKHTDSIYYMDITPDGQWLVSAGADGTARLWNVRTGDFVREFKTEQYMDSVVISADGKYIFTSGGDHLIHKWDAATGQELGKFEGHTAGTSKLALSHNGKLLASTSDDLTARVWNIDTLQETQRFIGFDLKTDYAAFSPDDSNVLIASWDSTARVFDASEEELLARACSAATRDLTEAERAVYAIDSAPTCP